MPRRRRPDVEPEILLPDVHIQQRQANNAIGPNYRARVTPVDYQAVNDGWICIFDRTKEVLQLIRQKGVGINGGLVSLMMQNCAKALVRPVLDANGNSLIKDGCTVHTLLRVGCRVYMTQDQIANLYGCSRQYVTDQIKKMREYGLIVNQGRGWYEFDAHLCWRGDFQIQKAYRQQQRVRDGWIITDGKTNLVTEDMNADDEGHSPQRVEEEEG